MIRDVYSNPDATAINSQREPSERPYGSAPYVRHDRSKPRKTQTQYISTREPAHLVANECIDRRQDHRWHHQTLFSTYPASLAGPRSLVAPLLTSGVFSLAGATEGASAASAAELAALGSILWEHAPGSTRCCCWCCCCCCCSVMLKYEYAQIVTTVIDIPIQEIASDTPAWMAAAVIKMILTPLAPTVEVNADV